MSSVRRILSLWFPRLCAEGILRAEGSAPSGPFAVVRNSGNMQVLVSLDIAASRAGLRPGQPLRDARAMCPELVTRFSNPQSEAAFLTVLRRWAGKFSPWVSELPPDGLMADLTGCAHLFGGEAALLEQIEGECAALGLSVCAGIADTVGAAWALARYAGQGAEAVRSGDAIDQEARATRSRAGKRRHWERGGAAPVHPGGGAAGRIAAPGQMHSALAPLPVAALRLPPEMVAQLGRLGLRRIDELAGQPRGALARRFGTELVLRLDQALGLVPEPVSPAKPLAHFAVRLTLPEPIGLLDDIRAGLDRLLPALAQRLREKGRGARRVRLQVFRCDHTMQQVEVGLARPSAQTDRLRPLLLMKLDEIDAGPGIDVLRLEAHVTEPVHATQHRGHLGAAADGATRMQRGGGAALDDLIGKLGARVGLEAITRLHPADSHIPEKATKVLAAAWSEPAQDWPTHSASPRPLLLFRPEPVHVEGEAAMPPRPPARFRWRRRELVVSGATGPERIAPEWWLEEPEWRSGVRDYWRVEVEGGERLWLFYAHGAALSAGWFCHGRFA
ncbi:Y-family DNA polymerase [Tropicimonas isoalkanivorans]|uniref:DNA-directed DNA polymerase n=1 Tax=Tropicimonas isoalkanivorans TaxID=441112 RepID=A0A1I1P3U4_9RHOB|nr:DNA polymerase Y family protein [Tropicimonas isoalkanivorans]SFD01653.1 protein ImuB [Tropicimonas isoalkanivorans]